MLSSSLFHKSGDSVVLRITTDEILIYRVLLTVLFWPKTGSQVTNIGAIMAPMTGPAMGLLWNDNFGPAMGNNVRPNVVTNHGPLMVNLLIFDH